MIHEMNLNAAPFKKIASGRKTVELRLFDAKRRRIDIGDSIIFTNLGNRVNKIAVTVKSLHRYATFEDLLADIPLEKCGFKRTDTLEIAAARMKNYYTAEQIQKYGVLGIEVVVTGEYAVMKQQKGKMY